jgi:hypothetical protein
MSALAGTVTPEAWETIAPHYDEHVTPTANSDVAEGRPRPRRRPTTDRPPRRRLWQRRPDDPRRPSRRTGPRRGLRTHHGRPARGAGPSRGTDEHPGAGDG